MKLQSIIKSVAGFFGSNRNRTSHPSVQRTSLALESLEGRDAPTGFNFNAAFALLALEASRFNAAHHQTYSPYRTTYHPTYTPSHYNAYGLNQTGLGENGVVTYNNLQTWNPFAATTPAMAASGFSHFNPMTLGL